MALSINTSNNGQFSYSPIKSSNNKDIEKNTSKSVNENTSKEQNTDKYVPSNPNTNAGTYSNLSCLKKVYVSYNGKRTSFYDLLQEANDKGIIDLKEGNTIGYYTEKSFNELVCKNSKTLYKGSHTRYTKDEKYIIKMGDDGNIEGFKRATTSNGVHLKEIANKLASGMQIKDMDNTELEFLRIADPELFKNAYKINEVQVSSKQFADMYASGEITKERYLSECDSLYYILLGLRPANSKNTPDLLSKLLKQPSEDLLKNIFSKNK